MTPDPVTQFSFGTVSAAGFSEPPRFRHREAAMEEVIDCTASNSPEELAIHFLLRHAACRMALTGQADEEALLQAMLRIRRDQRRQDVAPARTPAPVEAAPAARVTRDDSCAARFSRAYAAARHRASPADTGWRARDAA
ncbi:hypothetical protein [Rhodanobacter lindaniclasticus]|nr:hypothetical protein [Rhodanobacter lindaniclasticus]